MNDAVCARFMCGVSPPTSDIGGEYSEEVGRPRPVQHSHNWCNKKSECPVQDMTGAQLLVLTPPVSGHSGQHELRTCRVSCSVVTFAKNSQVSTIFDEWFCTSVSTVLPVRQYTRGARIPAPHGTEKRSTVKNSRPAPQQPDRLTDVPGRAKRRRNYSCFVNVKSSRVLGVGVCGNERNGNDGNKFS